MLALHPHRFRIVTTAMLVGGLVAACNPWGAAAPPRTSVGERTVEVPDSLVRVPVQIRTAALTAAIMEAYRSRPLSEGRSPEISAKLLIDEGTVVEKMVDILVAPARPGECIIRQVPKQIVRRMKVGVEAYGCALKPWKWGNCWRDVIRDVTETVLEPVKECSQAVAELWRKELQPVLEVHERLFPTSIWVNHGLHLMGMEMAASGNRISLVGDLRLNVGVDMRQGALGARMTVKGALACESELTLKLDADVHITPEATLDVRIAKVDLDWRKACIPGAVEAFDLASLLNPTLLVGSRALGAGLNSVLRKELNRAIQENAADDLNFRDDLIRVTPRLREAHPIGDQLWLEVKPSKIVVSDVRGEGAGTANALTIDAGFVGRPLITAGSRPTPAPGGQIPFELSSGPTGIAIAVEGAVPLAQAQGQVSSALRKAVDERFAGQPFTTGQVELYQSGEKLVAGVDIQNRSSGKTLGTVYLWATPALSDDRRSIRLSDVGFDVASRNVLVKSAAWLLDGLVEKTISDQSIAIGGALDKLLQQNGAFSADINVGLLRGSAATLEPGAIWVGGDSLRAVLIARGEARIDLKAPRLN